VSCAIQLAPELAEPQTAVDGVLSSSPPSKNKRKEEFIGGLHGQDHKHLEANDKRDSQLVLTLRDAQRKV
jgi:hypothetical protein